MKLIISLILALLLVMFAIQNPMPVKIKFLTWQTGDLSLIVIILLSALIGAFLATVFGFAKQKELKGKVKRKEEEIKKLIDDLERLKRTGGLL